MKKISFLILVGSLLLILNACKTDAGASSDTGTGTPVKRTVTVIPNGGMGLTQFVYSVDDGSPLAKLSNTPTMNYADFVGFTIGDTQDPFVLGQTKVTSDIKIIMQWKWKTFNCDGKNDTYQNYINAGNVEGLSCKLPTNINDAFDTAVNGTWKQGYNSIAEVLKYLVDNGADINRKYISGNSAILAITSYSVIDDVDAVSYLHYKGLDLTVANNDQKTALYFATATGKLKILKYLVENGVSLAYKDAAGNAVGNNLAMVAAAAGKLDVLQYLIGTAGISATERNNIGETALILAAQASQLDTVKYLLTLSGVSINDVDNDGMSALMRLLAFDTFGINTYSTVEYLTTVPTINLKIQAKTGTYAGKDALAIAQEVNASLKASGTASSSDIGTSDKIVALLTALWK